MEQPLNHRPIPNAQVPKKHLWSISIGHLGGEKELSCIVSISDLYFAHIPPARIILSDGYVTQDTERLLSISNDGVTVITTVGANLKLLGIIVISPCGPQAGPLSFRRKLARPRPPTTAEATLTPVLNALTPRHCPAPASQCDSNPSRMRHRPCNRRVGRGSAEHMARGVGRNSYSGHSSHRDWGSTGLVGILQWLDHFGPSQTQRCPAISPQPSRSVLISS